MSCLKLTSDVFFFYCRADLMLIFRIFGDRANLSSAIAGL